MCRKAQHHLNEGQHHFEQRENIVSHFTAQMNEVALRADILTNLHFCDKIELIERQVMK